MFAVFFVAAAAFAALAVPLWALRYAGLLDLPWRADAAWHGHEMLFGYALAVVGGYLLTKPGRRTLGAVFAAWLAARLVNWMPGVPPPLAAALSLAYPAALLVFAGLPLLRATKSWRNAVFFAVIAAFLAAELLHQSAALAILADGSRRGLLLAVDAFALLLFAMGGRVIGAASSGAVQRRGGRLDRPAQPGLERAGVAALLLMALVDLLDVAPLLAAACAALAAVIIALRLLRWRAWTLLGAPDLAVLYLGYAWLALGLALKAAGALNAAAVPADWLHGVAAGALGTLSVAMTARTVALRRRRPPLLPAPALAAALLVSVAAVLRLIAAFPALRLEALFASASAWSAAFLLLAVSLAASAGWFTPRACRRRG